MATAATLCVTRCFTPNLRVPGAQVRALLRRALPFALVLGFGVLYLRVDLIMLGLIGSEAAVGNYALASRVLETAIAVPSFFGGAFLATVAQTGAGTDRAAAQTAQALRYLLLICVPLAFALAVAAEPLIDLVAGGGYDQAGEVLVRLSPVLVLTAAYVVLANLQVALDRTKQLVRISLAGIALKIALNAWAIPRYGANGAAMAAVGGEVLVVIAQWYFARRDFDARATLAWCARLLTPVAAMLAAGALALGTIGWPAALVLGLVAFAVTALVTRCTSVAELRLALSSALARAP